MNFIKSHWKFLVGALAGAVMAFGAMSNSQTANMIGGYLADQAGVVIVAQPAAVSTTTAPVAQ